MKQKLTGILVVVACGLAVVLVSPADAAPARASITAKASPSEVDLGVAVSVQGQVVGARTAYVIVQRRMASGWYDRAQGTIDSSGRFSIRVRPTSSGIYAFRVVSAGRSLTSKTFYLRVWRSEYLADRPVDAGGNYFDALSITMGSKTYPKSLTRSGLSRCEGPRYGEWNLGGAYGRFTAVAGVDDYTQWTTYSAYYRVIGDGRVLASGTVKFGTKNTIDVSISGVKVLHLDALLVKTGGACTGHVSFGFGNPRIKR